MDVNATETAPEPAAGTDTGPTADAPSESVSAPANDVPADDVPADAPDPDGKGRAAREAAKYRTQLRETQTQLEGVAAKLEAMQLELARDVATRAGLVDGAEFNVPVAEFTDPETGLVDAAKVADATNALLTERPYLRRRTAWDDARPLSESAAEAMGGKSWSSFLAS